MRTTLLAICVLAQVVVAQYHNQQQQYPVKATYQAGQYNSQTYQQQLQQQHQQFHQQQSAAAGHQQRQHRQRTPYAKPTPAPYKQPYKANAAYNRPTTSQQHQQRQQQLQQQQLAAQQRQQSRTQIQAVSNGAHNAPHINYKAPTHQSYHVPLPQPQAAPHRTTAHQQIQKHSVSSMNTSPSRSSHAGCDLPPDLWCDSPQSAESCGVTQQCQALRRQARPLKLTLIYEALCPYCQKFISNQLGAIFNQFRGQFELEMVPWGNARILKDGSFSCNHGKKECDANKLQSCAIDVMKVKGALPFIVCLERAIQTTHIEGAIQQCQSLIRANYRQIRQCYDGERGMALQREAARITMTTRPNAIVEVPYLLINDYTPNVDNNNLNIMMLPQLLNKWTKLYRA